MSCALTVLSASLPAIHEHHARAIERILGRENKGLTFRCVHISIDLEGRPFKIEAEARRPKSERRIGLGPADKHHFVMTKQIIGNFEILVDGNRALVGIQKLVLELFGGVTIGARASRKVP